MELFISYSHKDLSYKEALETHLALLKRNQTIRTWSDREIIASAMVASINVVAVFDIHIDNSAAVNMKPKTRRRPDVPTMLII